MKTQQVTLSSVSSHRLYCQNGRHRTRTLMLLIRANPEYLPQTWPFIFFLRDAAVEVSISRSESSSTLPGAAANGSLHKLLGTLLSVPTPVKRRRPGNVPSNLLSDISPCLGAPGAAPPGGEEKLICTAAAASHRYTSFYTNIRHSWPQIRVVTESGRVSPSASQRVSLFIVLFTEMHLFNACNFMSRDVLRYSEGLPGLRTVFDIQF